MFVGKDAFTKFITGRDDWYKFLWVGNHADTGGVGILFAKKWVQKMLDVNRVSVHICSLN